MEKFLVIADSYGGPFWFVVRGTSRSRTYNALDRSMASRKWVRMMSCEVFGIDEDEVEDVPFDPEEHEYHLVPLDHVESSEAIRLKKKKKLGSVGRRNGHRAHP